MPTYSINGPDGKTYSIDGPEGATKDQVIAKIKERQSVERPQSSLEKLFGIGGPRYQTFPERAAREGLGVLKSFMDAPSKAPVGSRELTESAAGPAWELATMVSPMGPETRLAKEGARTALKSAEKSPADMNRLFDSATADYKAIDSLGLEFKPEGFNRLADSIKQKLTASNFRDYISPAQSATFKAIDELTTKINKKGEIVSQPISYKISELDNVRQRLRRISKSDPDDASASAARKLIDEYMDTMKAPDIAKGVEDVEKAKQLFGQARSKYSAASRLEDISKMKGSAENRSAIPRKGFDEKLRKEFQWVMDPHYPERRRGWTKEEQDQMQKIIKGTNVGNTAHLISKLSLYHPLTGWGPAIAAEIAGSAKGVPGAGIMTLGAGHVAHKIAERVPERQVENLERMVWNRSPLGAEEVTKNQIVGQSASKLKQMTELEALIRMLGPATGAMQERPQ